MQKWSEIKALLASITGWPNGKGRWVIIMLVPGWSFPPCYSLDFFSIALSWIICLHFVYSHRSAQENWDF